VQGSASWTLNSVWIRTSSILTQLINRVRKTTSQMTADAYICNLDIVNIVHTKKKTLQKKGGKKELQDSSSFSQPVKQKWRAKRLHLQFNS
jgi:hypothetical protein